MKKWFRTAALMAALAATAGSVTVAAPQEKKAQDKKKEDKKKADEKKDGEKKEAAGKIEVYKGKNGYRYRIKNADGKTIAMPLPQMSWETKEDCLKAIEDLKATLNKATPTDVKE